MTILILPLLFVFQSEPLLREWYNLGQYDSVIVLADSMLKDSTTGQPIEVMKYKAYALIARGRIDNAKQVFNRILDLDPLVTLNPREVSPKIINVFDEVKRSHAWMTTVKVQVETLLVRPSKKNLILSLAYPGLVQVYSNRKSTGWALIASETFSISGIIISSLLYNRAHNSYLAETDPELIPAKYDDCNLWFRTRIGLISTAALIYIYNIFDVASNPQ